MRDEARRDALFRKLGEVTAALAKLPAPAPAAPDPAQLKIAVAADKRSALGTTVAGLEASVKAAEKATDDATVAQRKKDETALAGKKVELALLDVGLTKLQKDQLAAAPDANAEVKADAHIADLTDATVSNALDQQLNDTFLRKHGFAVNLGYGYLPSLRNYSPDIQVRYNFFHDKHFADVKQDVQERRTGHRRTVADKYHDFSLITDVSGWIGYPLQKLGNERRTAGGQTFEAGTQKEAPLVVGLGLGLGNGYEFSSAVSINAGVALFNNTAFKREQLYVGVGVDAVLFKAVAKALASAAGN